MEAPGRRGPHREAIIKRACSIAERLNRRADGLEADPEYSYNTVGEQGNEVELDTWCTKLGFADEMLQLFRPAQTHAAQAERR